MTTPIDRESVERLAGLLRLDAKELEGLIGVGYHSRLASAPDTLLALRAALDAAEAEIARLREAIEQTTSESCEGWCLENGGKGKFENCYGCIIHARATLQENPDG